MPSGDHNRAAARTVAAVVAGVGPMLLSGCGGPSGVQVALGIHEAGLSEAGLDADAESRDTDVLADATTAPSMEAGAEASTGCTVAPDSKGGWWDPGEGGACAIIWQETCDGALYTATCACPQGTCGCVGQTTSVVSFGCQANSNCLAMSASDVLALCGFPK